MSPDPVYADAWSTALFVMGKEEGLKNIEKTSETEILMITPDKKITYSSGLEGKIDIVKNKT